MKTFVPLSITIFLNFYVMIVTAQTAPPRSSKAEAQYDAACIASNIADSRDIMHFSRTAIDKSKNKDIVELAKAMQDDFTEILYGMEQLAVSGASASAGTPQETESGTFEQAGALDEALSSTREFKFDTTWTGGLLRLFQFKLDALTVQKEKVTNSRLKTAVNEAVPVLRRTIPRLSSLQKSMIRQDLQQKREAAKLEKAKKQKKQ